MDNELQKILRLENVYDFIIKKYHGNHKSLFFNDKYKKTFVGGLAFTGFQLKSIEKHTRPTSGFKLHYAVDHKDLEKAIEIIGNVCGQHNIQLFKVINYPFGQSKLNRHADFYAEQEKKGIIIETPPHDQDGKDFTIYIGEGQDNPLFIQKFVQNIEDALSQNGIRPAPRLGYNILCGDKPIKGSAYGFYRYPRGSNGEELSRHAFTPPPQGDLMEKISVSNSVFQGNSDDYVFSSTDEFKNVKAVLNAFNIPFFEQRNDPEAIKHHPNLPTYRLFPQKTALIQKLLSYIHQASFKNVYTEEFENSYQTKQAQRLLDKINVSSCRIQSIKDPNGIKRVLLAQQGVLLKQLIKRTNSKNLSEIDAALVSSKDEANRLFYLLKNNDIPSVKIAYKKEDGSLQYSLIYKKDSKTDQLLRSMNADLLDEKKALINAPLYAKKMKKEIG